jgi:hypothetical protein
MASSLARFDVALCVFSGKRALFLTAASLYNTLRCRGWLPAARTRGSFRPSPTEEDAVSNQVELKASGNTIEVSATGKLTKEFYQQFVPSLEKQIQEQGKLRILFQMHDFHGWTAGALWEDVKFDLRHCRDIERLAIVGESKWQQGMAAFCKPFTSARIQYFSHDQLDAARKWLASDE